jgi:hypothetical protein
MLRNIWVKKTGKLFVKLFWKLVMLNVLEKKITKFFFKFPKFLTNKKGKYW